MSPITSITSAAVREPSPFAKLRALIARLINADGPSMETDLANEFLTEGQAGITAAADSSGKVETALDRYTRLWTAYWSDGDLSLREKASLAREMIGLKRQAHTTTTKINCIRF